MATPTQVSTYIESIRKELGYYGGRLVDRSQWDHEPLVQKQVKLMLLEAFEAIAERYLDEYDDTTNNMFNQDGFETIEKHINRICNSFHWIDLS